MSKVDYSDMFANAVHIGHRTHKWNPRMKKYIYGEKNGVHVLNLELTKNLLDEALSYMAKLVGEGRQILFVSTKLQSISLVEKTAKELNMPYVVSQWIPGLLTNFGTLKTRIKYMVDLGDQEQSGEFAKYTKKEAAKLKKTIDKLEMSLGGVRNLTRLPDAVFVVDSVRDAIVVQEARKLNIPVIGLADTNTDPTLLDYPVPANDDAIKSLKFIFAKIVEALKGSSKSKK